uniref:Phorbol-ester/DAG-type domain-containing protein n=1 Tax=Steinernema glaseri TaxID=37863 RepID=A0A1I7Y2G2_9BILA
MSSPESMDGDHGLIMKSCRSSNDDVVSVDEPQEEEECFVDLQIVDMIQKERRQNPDLDRMGELAIAVEYCKQRLTDDSGLNRKQVMERLVELRLEMQESKSGLEAGDKTLARVAGHEFVLQPANGRNPYCEACMSTIWRIIQQWRRCRVCGYRAHDKCLERVRRTCAGVKVARPGFQLKTDICKERGLAFQNYKCAECKHPLSFEKGADFEPRLCDMEGLYFCRFCHFNDRMVIPARVVHNMDTERYPVSRGAKQLLTIVDKKPLLDLQALNPALFKVDDRLKQMQEMRRNILFMKCYFMCCKKAQKLRILQYLNRHQHFVETSDLYSLNDLQQLVAGRLIPEIAGIVEVFRKHIVEECETCLGKAFICELCNDKSLLFPFSRNVGICPECCNVFHEKCFDRASRYCPRCKRRKVRTQPQAPPNGESA